MNYEFGKLLFMTKLGTSYYAADKNGVAKIHCRNGSIIYIDSDIMDYVISNDLRVSLCKNKRKIKSVFDEGNVNITNSSDREHIAMLQSVVCGIPNEDLSKYIFRFKDGNSLNMLRSNIIIYPRLYEISEPDADKIKYVINSAILTTASEVIGHELIIDCFNRDIIDNNVFSIQQINRGIDKSNSVYAMSTPSKNKSRVIILDEIMNRISGLVDTLALYNVHIDKLYRIDTSILDFSLDNISISKLYTSNKDLSESELTSLYGVSVKSGNISIDPYKIGTSKSKPLRLSIDLHGKEFIADLATRFSNDIVRIKSYSIRDLINNRDKIAEVASLVNGDITEKYRHEVQKNKSRFK